MTKPAMTMPTLHATRAMLAAIALAALVVLVFAQVRDFEFVNFDDPAYILDNPRVNTGLSLDNARWAFTAHHAGNWHPLTWLSHQLDVSLFGLEPSAHHLTSVFIHLLNTLLVFGLLLAATRRDPAMFWACVVVAAVFAAHPLRAETVAWVSERKDVLCAFFWLLTLAAYAHYARRPSIGRYATVALAMALAMLAKPMAVTLPCVLLLLDVWPLRRIPLGNSFLSQGIRLTLEKAPLFLLSIGLAAMTIIAQDASGAVQSLGNTSLLVRMSNIPVAYVSYLGQMVWPFNLAVSYPLPLDGQPLWKTLAATVALLLVTAAVLWKARTRPWLPVGWFYYLGTLVPVIGLVQVGDQAMADRYTYLPHLGITVMAAWLSTNAYQRLEQPIARRVFAAAVLLLVCAMAARAHDQVGHWRDNLTLWAHAARAVPHSYLAQTNLAVELEARGAIERAAHHYRAAIEAEPHQATGHYNYGNFLQMAGEPEAALHHLDEALALDPDHIPTRTARATALFGLERYAEAEAEFRDVLEHEPDDPVASTNLAAVLLAQQRFAEAETLLRTILQRDGESVETLTNLALACVALGRVNEAYPMLERAMELNPAYQPARNLVRALGGEIIDHPPAD